MLWMVFGTAPTLGSVIGGTVAGLKVGSGVGSGGGVGVAGAGVGTEKAILGFHCFPKVRVLSNGSLAVTVKRNLPAMDSAVSRERVRVSPAGMLAKV